MTLESCIQTRDSQQDRHGTEVLSQSNVRLLYEVRSTVVSGDFVRNLECLQIPTRNFSYFLLLAPHRIIPLVPRREDLLWGIKKSNN